jgi:glycogen debranching enzyme
MEGALAVMSAMFDASVFMDLHRLPELYCGFARRPSEGPTLYPVACSPQAWASGVVFGLIQATLRLSIDVGAKQLCVDRPMLPPFLTHLRLLNLDVSFGTVDLLFERHPLDISVTVLRKDADIDVRVVK